MNIKTQQKLEQLHDCGYLIQIEAGSYVSGNVSSICTYDKDEDDDDFDPILEGQKVYSDEVYTDRPLSEVMLQEIKVFKPINFLTEEIEETDEIYITEEQEEAHWIHNKVKAFMLNYPEIDLSSIPLITLVGNQLFHEWLEDTSPEYLQETKAIHIHKDMIYHEMKDGTFNSMLDNWDYTFDTQEEMKAQIDIVYEAYNG